MPLSPEHLLKRLIESPPATTYWVAYSGGLDSHVLLHTMAQIRRRLPGKLRAIHVNHGLQQQAAEWAKHCQTVCDALHIKLETVDLKLKIEKGESLEAKARDARYQAISEMIKSGEMLLTAHHQDDQAETLMLQLLRGAGPHGLAAMPAQARFSDGIHLRPLLEFTRDQLQCYAEQAGLRWVEDESNRSLDFDRNYLRHAIMPRLKSRWPGMSKTFARSARYCAEASQLIDSESAALLQPLLYPEGTINLAGIKALNRQQQRLVIRAWIDQKKYLMPDSAHLERVVDEVIGARPDRNPLVEWSGTQIRRYRNKLYLLTKMPRHDPTLKLPWKGSAKLQLPFEMGTLWLTDNNGRSLTPEQLGRQSLYIGFRQGGEHCMPAGRGCTKTIKSLFQEAGVLPWMRDLVPIVYLENKILAVCGICQCEPFGAEDPNLGLEVHWAFNERLFACQ